MVIRALDHVSQCYSDTDGRALNGFIRTELRKGRRAIVSLADVDFVSSSFVNEAFVALLDAYDITYVRSHLVIADANKQAADMVRRCFDAAEAPPEERLRA